MATDRELQTMLADQGLWLVRAGMDNLPCRNLQSGLAIAWELERSNRPVQAIVRLPKDQPAVLPDQICRLWKLFNFADSMGRTIKPSGPPSDAAAGSNPA